MSITSTTCFRKRNCLAERLSSLVALSFVRYVASNLSRVASTTHRHRERPLPSDVIDTANFRYGSVSAKSPPPNVVGYVSQSGRPSTAARRLMVLPAAKSQSGQELPVATDRFRVGYLAMTSAVRYLQVAPEEASLPDLGSLPRFRAVVLAREVVSNDWRNRVSDWLVAAGCLYMLAWGHECSVWDDALD